MSLVKKSNLLNYGYHTDFELNMMIGQARRWRLNLLRKSSCCSPADIIGCSLAKSRTLWLTVRTGFTPVKADQESSFQPGWRANQHDRAWVCVMSHERWVRSCSRWCVSRPSPSSLCLQVARLHVVTNVSSEKCGTLHCTNVWTFPCGLPRQFLKAVTRFDWTNTSSA